MFLLWINMRLSFAVGADLSLDIYRRTLFQPYAVHCSRSSSEVISGITTKASNLTHNILVPVLVLISSTVMLMVVLVTLLVLEPLIALLTFGGFGGVYLVVARLTRKRLRADSECVARESVQVIKSLQEGLGGIRDVLLDGSQASYCEVYAKSDRALRQAQGHSAFVAGSPRFAMEALGMVLIAVLAYFITQQDSGLTKAVPILGALALAAQRMLPNLQQVYGAWANIQAGLASLKDSLELLDQPLPEQPKPLEKEYLAFGSRISLKNVGFRYDGQSPFVLNQLDLVISKGSRTGFIGTSGSGKSTLIDIIMGLLQPTTGVLEVDNQPVTVANCRAWQARLAHVPQAIFLADCSVEENIAFGVPRHQIDHERVVEAARQARVADMIEMWPDGYQTAVGERGVRLSGGQRQRIGIARALYKQADVIIFDEATSALDSETEQEVMQAIEGLSSDLTLLIIAHRVSTLKNCTQIVELGGGKIRQIGSYHEVCIQAATT
jgi:ATP-binding cassette subfamily B protein